jgi:histidine triad (HIT) family protein
VPDACPFCVRIAAGEVEHRWPFGTSIPLVVAFTPLDPVTPGHTLVVPVQHVEDVAADPWWSAMTMRAAAEVAEWVGDCNVITSRGVAATQSVRHLHLHVVPRRAGDGLALPWTGQQQADAARIGVC